MVGLISPEYLGHMTIIELTINLFHWSTRVSLYSKPSLKDWITLSSCIFSYSTIHTIE